MVLVAVVVLFFLGGLVFGEPAAAFMRPYFWEYWITLIVPCVLGGTFGFALISIVISIFDKGRILKFASDLFLACVGIFFVSLAGGVVMKLGILFQDILIHYI